VTEVAEEEAEKGWSRKVVYYKYLMNKGRVGTRRIGSMSLGR
jgi:hypothetical protein